MKNLYEESLTNLGLISTPRINECTAFYNCHVAGIKVSVSNSSSVFCVITGMPLFTFVAAKTGVCLAFA
jgi:hypothetical protein